MYSLYYFYNFFCRIKIFQNKKSWKEYHIKINLKICWPKDKMQETKLWWAKLEAEQGQKVKICDFSWLYSCRAPCCLWIFYHMPHSLQIRNQTYSHNVRIMNSWPCGPRKSCLRGSFYSLNYFLSSFLETWSLDPTEFSFPWL